MRAGGERFRFSGINLSRRGILPKHPANSNQYRGYCSLFHYPSIAAGRLIFGLAGKTRQRLESPDSVFYMQKNYYLLCGLNKSGITFLILPDIFGGLPYGL